MVRVPCELKDGPAAHGRTGRRYHYKCIKKTKAEVEQLRGCLPAEQRDRSEANGHLIQPVVRAVPADAFYCPACVEKSGNKLKSIRECLGGDGARRVVGRGRGEGECEEGRRGASSLPELSTVWFMLAHHRDSSRSAERSVYFCRQSRKRLAKIDKPADTVALPRRTHRYV